MLSIILYNSLEKNNIGATGAAVIADWLKANDTLTELELVYLYVLAFFPSHRPPVTAVVPIASHVVYISSFLLPLLCILFVRLFSSCLCFPFLLLLTISQSVCFLNRFHIYILADLVSF